MGISKLQDLLRIGHSTQNQVKEGYRDFAKVIEGGGDLSGPVQFLFWQGYSCRKASIGFIRDARNAGIIPLTSPTKPRMSVDAISVPGAMISRMSPASPFLANALYKVSLPTDSATA